MSITITSASAITSAKGIFLDPVGALRRPERSEGRVRPRKGDMSITITSAITSAKGEG